MAPFNFFLNFLEVPQGSILGPSFCFKSVITYHTAQKLKFSTKEFVSKCDQTHSFLRIGSHLLNKSLMEYFIFRAVSNDIVSLVKQKYVGNHVCMYIDGT